MTPRNSRARPVTVAGADVATDSADSTGSAVVLAVATGGGLAALAAAGRMLPRRRAARS